MTKIEEATVEEASRAIEVVSMGAEGEAAAGAEEAMIIKWAAILTHCSALTQISNLNRVIYGDHLLNRKI